MSGTGITNFPFENNRVLPSTIDTAANAQLQQPLLTSKLVGGKRRTAKKIGGWRIHHKASKSMKSHIGKSPMMRGGKRQTKKTRRYANRK